MIPPAPWEHPLLPVWPTKYAPAWPRSDTGRAWRLSLCDALIARYSTDAHFAAYSHAMGLRLSTDALGQLATPPIMGALVVDVDAPSKARTDAWCADIERRVSALRGVYGYWTQGGARLVWLLPEPRDVATWARWYVSTLVDVYAATGIEGDVACKDWTRLFRLPFATRDGVAQDLGDVCGTPETIGYWADLPVGDSDRAKARETLASLPGWRYALEAPKAVTTDPVALPKGNVGKLLARACEGVRAASEGRRNNALYAAAKWIGKLVAKGELAEQEARGELSRVAVSVGLSRSEVASVLRSAWRRG